MPGARCARSLACRKGRKHTSSSHHGHTGNTRHSPRNGFNKLLRALPGEPGFLATVACGYRFRRLDTSVGVSGPHDFAVRETAPFVSALPTSIASRPASVTIASRPSEWDRMAWV
jgi:hypothetical protein